MKEDKRKHQYLINLWEEYLKDTKKDRFAEEDEGGKVYFKGNFHDFINWLKKKSKLT